MLCPGGLISGDPAGFAKNPRSVRAEEDSNPSAPRPAPIEADRGFARCLFGHRSCEMVLREGEHLGKGLPYLRFGSSSEDLAIGSKAIVFSGS